MHNSMVRTYMPEILLVLIGGFVGAVLFIGPHPVASQASGAPMTGYLWSDTIGWIDLNCANTNSCSTRNFGLSIAADGTVSGYAWSDSIGWISANASDLAGCPAGACAAQIGAGGGMTGWLHALASDNNGWGGWISLSGTNYGVTETGGAFSGYAWGDTNVGWVDFSRAQSIYGTCDTTQPVCTGGHTLQYFNKACQVVSSTSCTAPAFCTNGIAFCQYPPVTFIASGGLTGHLQVTPSVVRSGDTTTVHWDIANVKNDCTVQGTNHDGPWTTVYDPVTATFANAQPSGAINQETTYTLHCTGIDGTSVNESATVNTLPVFREQ